MSEQHKSDTEQWSCQHCGQKEHDSILVINDEIEVDVTCQSVYFTFNDDSGDPGIAFNKETFERIIEHYKRSPTTDTDQ